MATYDSKYIAGSVLEGLLSSAFNLFKRVAYTGSYNDLKDKPAIPEVDTMTASEATQLASAVNAVRTVTYVANEPGATGTMDTDIVHVGDVYTVKACAYQVSGKTFDGWYEDPYQVAYANYPVDPGDEVTITDSITYYACFVNSE